jgi:hypothetical protein
MKALQLTLLGAVDYLSKRPNLRANAGDLVDECRCWVAYTFPSCPASCRAAGEHAAREVARPVKRV